MSIEISNQEVATMFGSIGPSEMTVILFAVLLLFGAKRLPEVARSLGRSISEFKRAMHSTVSEVQGTFEESKIKKEIKE